MKYILIDDEELARARLKSMIEELSPDWFFLGEAEHVHDAIKLIHKTKPDVLFLDIQMPQLSGFDMLELLPPDFSTPIVFVTAFDEYAIKAFEAHALDYLLKPVKKIRLENTMARIQKAKTGLQPDELTQLLGLKSQPVTKKLPVNHKQETLLLDLDSILWIESRDTITFVHTKQGQTYRSDRTLDELESRLEDFFRLHRSYLVAIQSIAKLIPWFNGGLKVELSSGLQLEVAKRRVSDLKKILDA